MTVQAALDKVLVDQLEAESDSATGSGGAGTDGDV